MIDEDTQNMKKKSSKTELYCTGKINWFSEKKVYFLLKMYATAPTRGITDGFFSGVL